MLLSLKIYISCLCCILHAAVISIFLTCGFIKVIHIYLYTVYCMKNKISDLRGKYLRVLKKQDKVSWNKWSKVQWREVDKISFFERLGILSGSCEALKLVTLAGDLWHWSINNTGVFLFFQLKIIIDCLLSITEVLGWMEMEGRVAITNQRAAGESERCELIHTVSFLQLKLVDQE